MRVRVGVIGTSPWAEFVFLETLQNHPDGSVVALSGRNSARLAELAAKFGVEHTFTDWSDLITSGLVDAVIVATPDELHHDIVMAAAEAGLAVMCEKPLAMNAADAREMLDAVTSRGLINNVMFTWRHQPAARLLKRLVDQGVLGAPIHSNFEFVMGYARNDEYQWRLDAEHGTGALGDLGVHLTDFAQWMRSPITTVQASLHHAYDRVTAAGAAVAPINDSSIMLVSFADGSHGTLTASLVTEVADRTLIFKAMLAGTEATLEYELISEGPQAGARVYISLAGEPMRLVEIPEDLQGQSAPNDLWGHLTRQSLGARQFVASVRSGEQQGPDFADGFRAQLVIDAAFVSAREGARISIR